ncbi:hypothetical protein FSP39_004809 [Pinctada imbricata]|uniref:Uncharacterized protein n=1 Tax=Pinctada imbricata TaxID=66713 RepID=A0AA88Y2F5_PINIB|nr:hypothetical protein FSP39_004809 [Pinctada imbricata]
MPAYFSRFKPVKVSAEKVVMDVQPRDCYIGMDSNFTIRIEDESVSASDIRAELKGPDSEPHVHLNWSGRTAHCTFTPVETGHHRLSVFCEGQLIVGCPLSFKVLADRSKIAFSGVEKCAVGSITELTVNSMSAGQGDVQVEARAPGGRVHRLSAMYRNGNYVMDFTPSEVGVWQINVNYDGEHIGGSPFQIHVYDPAAVKVYGLEGGTVGSGLAFNADTSSAGDGELRVKVLYEGQSVPAYVATQRAGLYRIDFTPEGAGTYKVHCYYNDIEVRGSPYTLDIVDSSRVSVRGDGLTLVPVNRVAKFVVETGGSKGRVQVEITGPDKNKLTPTITENSNGQHEVEYFPSIAGDYQIYVYYCGQLVNGTAFNCKVFDAGKILVSNMPDHAILGNAVTFNIDASRAGSGNIEIMVNQGRVACSVENLGNYKFVASFIPESLESYAVEMKFNSVPIHGSPWNIPVFDPKSVIVMGDGLDFVLVGRKSKFTISGGKEFADELFVNITAPSGQNVMYDMREENGEQIVEYTPMEVGDHMIKVEYRESEVEGSPFKAKAYATSAILVSPLQDGLVGSPVDFTIDVTRAGEGQLEIMVNNGNLPNTVDMETTGVYKISFVPEEDGVQTVHINFNSEALPGSPFTCNAADLSGATVSGLKTLLPTNILSAFTVETISTSGRDVGAEVDIISPSGTKILAQIKETSPGKYCVEFVPQEVGSHLVEVFLCGKLVKGFPHVVKVYDSTKVRVITGGNKGFHNVPVEMILDVGQCGEGQIEVVVTNNEVTIPSQAEQHGEGRILVSFLPKEGGVYCVNVTFNGESIIGSPFYMDVTGPTTAKMITESMVTKETSVVTRSQQMTLGAQTGNYIVDQQQWIWLEAFGSDILDLTDLELLILAPDGTRIPARILSQSDGNFKVEWTPSKPGRHRVEVQYAGRAVDGSPFYVDVFDLATIRIQNFRQSGIGEPASFELDLKEVGLHDFNVLIRSPGGQIVDHNVANDLSSLTKSISYIPTESGPHEIYVNYITFELPGIDFERSISFNRAKYTLAEK